MARGPKPTMFVGDIYTSEKYGDIEVLAYKDSAEVQVRFLDTGFISWFDASSIRKGLVFDRLARNIADVGFLGEGPYPSSIKSKNTLAYVTWRGILARCYDPYEINCNNLSYRNVTVCEEWHNHQNFAKWFHENYKEGCEVDKDTLQRGVTYKIYSPDTCIFITKSANAIEAKAKHYVFIDPKGEVVNVYNLSAFSKKKGLSCGNMWSVWKGQRKHCAGWRKYPCST